MSTTITGPAERFLAGPLLGGIDETSRLAIFRMLVESPVSAGSALTVQGKPNDRLWFVLKGAVAVEQTRADGRPEILATMSGPGIFGTTSFFRPSPVTSTIRATSDLLALTLDHRGHDRLRAEDPRAAEALALSVVRVLAERFDILDRRVGELMAEHDDNRPASNEWSRFRARLFEEPTS